MKLPSFFHLFAIVFIVVTNFWDFSAERLNEYLQKILAKGDWRKEGHQKLYLKRWTSLYWVIPRQFVLRSVRTQSGKGLRLNPSLEEKILMHHDNFTIECSDNNDPVNWSIPYPKKNKVSNTWVGKNVSQLHIVNANVYNSGTYTCSAGNSSVEIFIGVENSKPTEEIEGTTDEMETSFTSNDTGIDFWWIVLVLLVVLLFLSSIAVIIVMVLRKKNCFNRAAEISLNPIYSRTELRKLNRIGSGHFSTVYRGEWHTSGNVLVIAIKKVTQVVLHNDFHQEVEVMSMLDHTNIVKFFGTYQSGPRTMFPYILMEFMPSRDLKNVLLSSSADLLTREWKLEVMQQIAEAVRHLEIRRIVHRDLACRNILVRSDEILTIKISDFGLSRNIVDEYQGTTDRELPVKWMAPESIRNRIFNFKTEIWSVGIVFFEILRNGTDPYYEIPEVVILDAARNREIVRLDLPTDGNDDIVAIIENCTNQEPNERNTIDQICSNILALRPQADNLQNDVLEINEVMA